MIYDERDWVDLLEIVERRAKSKARQATAYQEREAMRLKALEERQMPPTWRIARDEKKNGNATGSKFIMIAHNKKKRGEKWGVKAAQQRERIEAQHQMAPNKRDDARMRRGRVSISKGGYA